WSVEDARRPTTINSTACEVNPSLLLFRSLREAQEECERLTGIRHSVGDHDRDLSTSNKVPWSQGEIKSPQIPMAPTIVYQLPPPIQWESYSYGPRGWVRGGLFGIRARGRAGRGGAGSSSCLVCGQMDHWARNCPQRYGARPEGAPPPSHQSPGQQGPFPAQPPNAAFIPSQGCQYPVQGWGQQ
ncbi:hypothetical protein XENOCAPTIV_021521, partial [Xenoophorus captivus]